MGNCLSVEDKASVSDVLAGVDDSKWVTPKGVQSVVKSGVYADGELVKVRKDFVGFYRSDFALIYEPYVNNGTYIRLNNTPYIYFVDDENHFIYNALKRQSSGTYYLNLFHGEYNAGMVPNQEINLSTNILSNFFAVNGDESAAPMFTFPCYDNRLICYNGGRGYTYVKVRPPGNSIEITYYSPLFGNAPLGMTKRYTYSLLLNSSNRYVLYAKDIIANTNEFNFSISNDVSSGALQVAAVYGENVIYLINNEASYGIIKKVTLDTESIYQNILNLPTTNGVSFIPICFDDRYFYAFVKKSSTFDTYGKIFRYDMANDTSNYDVVIQSGTVHLPHIKKSSQKLFYFGTVDYRHYVITFEDDMFTLYTIDKNAFTFNIASLINYGSNSLLYMIAQFILHYYPVHTIELAYPPDVIPSHLIIRNGIVIDVKRYRIYLAVGVPRNSSAASYEYNPSYMAYDTPYVIHRTGNDINNNGIVVHHTIGTRITTPMFSMAYYETFSGTNSRPIIGGKVAYNLMNE